jgi:hypothetical protein
MIRLFFNYRCAQRPSRAALDQRPDGQVQQLGEAGLQRDGAASAHIRADLAANHRRGKLDHFDLLFLIFNWKEIQCNEQNH